MIQLKAIEPTLGELPVLLATLQRIFYRKDPRPVMPVQAALAAVRALDALEGRQAEAFDQSARVAEMYEGDREKLREVALQRVSVDAPEVHTEQLVAWKLMIDPEATVVLRHHGLLFEGGEAA